MNTTDMPMQPAHPASTPNPAAEGVLDRLCAWLEASLVQQAAGELARECQAAAWEATCAKTRRMSRDEARGYIRAFAPEFLGKEVDLVMQRRRVRESLRPRILAEAAEQLVELVVKDLSRTRSYRSIGRVA